MGSRESGRCVDGRPAGEITPRGGIMLASSLGAR